MNERDRGSSREAPTVLERPTQLSPELATDPPFDTAQDRRAEAPEPLEDFDDTSFELGREVARGGMGRILEARDRHLSRPVAIKELIDRSPEAQTRFVREALITARLQHPSIVPIYRAGRRADGTVAYAMKMIEGRSLKRAIDERESLEERLALLDRLVPVIDAMAYAHDQGVIHRDLKPSNIILGDYGESIVIDWGIARRMGEPDDAAAGAEDLGDDDAGLTRTGALIGTPPYMPPEQANSEPVGPPADVYALGAVLYHLVAGAPPYEGSSAAMIAARVVDEPPPPLLERAPEAPRDLVAIVERAMARRSVDRYSAGELAAELRAFAAGRRVAAHDYSAGELIRRWLRRHRAAVAVAGVAAALLAALAIAAAVALIRERDAALAAEKLAASRADTLAIQRARELAHDDPIAALTLLSGLGAGSPAWRGARVIAADIDENGIPRLAGRAPPPVRELWLAPGGELIAIDGDGLGRWRGRRRRQLAAAPAAYAFSPAGDALVWIAGASIERLGSGDVERVGTAAAPIAALAIANGGARVAVAAGDEVWIFAGGEPERVEGDLDGIAWLGLTGDADVLWAGFALEDPDDPAGALAPLGELRHYSRSRRQWATARQDRLDPATLLLAPDGSGIAYTNGRGVVSRYDFAIGRTELTVTGGRGPEQEIQGLAIHPDGRRVALADHRGQLRLMVPGPDPSGHTHTASVVGLAFAPDGGSVVTAGADGAVSHFTFGDTSYRVWRHEQPITAMAISPDSAAVAVATSDGAIWLREAPRARTVAAGDGERIALGAAGALAVGEDRLAWLAPGGEPRPGIVAGGRIALAAAAIGERAAVVTESAPNEIQVLDARGGKRAIPVSDEPLDALAAAGAAPVAVAADRGGRVYRIDLDSGEVSAVAALAAPPVAVAVSPDGAAIAATDGATLHGAGAAIARPCPGAITGVAAGVEVVIALCDDWRAIAFDRASGAIVTAFEHSAVPAAAALSPDGERLLVGAGAGELTLHDLATGARMQRDFGDSGLSGVAFVGAWLAFTDGRTLTWIPDHLPAGEAALRAWIEARLAAAR